MGQTNKSKIKIREIPSKIKIIESQSSDKKDIKEESREVPLESVVSEAPSAREFPSLNTGRVREIPSEREEIETPTPSATTSTEASSGQRYTIQGNISEREIRRIYRTEPVNNLQRNPTAIIRERPDNGDAFRRTEIASRNTRDNADEKYDISIGEKPSNAKKRYPWE